MAERPNVSADLIWACVRSNNAFLDKRRSGGGAQFSRDPFNLTNKATRTQSGFVNDKAVGLSDDGNGGIKLVTKKSSKHHHRPASSQNEVTWGKDKSSRKIYSGLANHTAKNSYRSDLRGDAIARASAIRQSQQPKKDAPAKKPRGAKAKSIEA